MPDATVSLALIEAARTLTRLFLNQQCFSTLRKAIREKPESNGIYSPEQIDRMVTARREFRVALRADILLLFNEDLEVDFLED